MNKEVLCTNRIGSALMGNESNFGKERKGMPCELCANELKTGLAMYWVLIGKRKCFVCGQHLALLQQIVS